MIHRPGGNPVSRFRELHLVLLVWLCFLMRGLFYTVMFPIWEGFDEYAHFAYVQCLAGKGRLPESGSLVSREVEESLKLLPLPWMLREWGPPYVTHDQYWKLSRQERELRTAGLYVLPRSWADQPADQHLPLYETQQPPLYYWLMSVPLRAASALSLPGRVLLLRLLSLLLASLAVPAAFLLADSVLRSREAALGMSALVFIMPELMVDVCRVGNDSLALPLYTVLAYAVLVFAEHPRRRRTALLLAAGLGLGLLTKAYFLTAVPALILIILSRIRRPETRGLLVRGSAIVAVALVLSAWWYWRNHSLMGSWSGLMQDVSLRDLPLAELLQNIPAVDWKNALDSTLTSHIWFGNWSFLQVRSWIYHSYQCAGLLALIGLLVYWMKVLLGRLPAEFPRPRQLMTLGALYGFFCFGLCYHVLITFIANGQSSSAGWYLYCPIVAQTLLIFTGLAVISPAGIRAGILSAATISFGLLDLYTVHFLSIPYYTGLIAHRADGTLATFALHQVREVGIWNIFVRLSINRAFLSPTMGALIWLGYLAATLTLMVLAVRLARRTVWDRPPAR